MKKKILINAYACEPNEGSEPGVGWNWALEIKKNGHNLLIVTRKNNKKKIQNYLKKNKTLNIKDFYFFDLNNFFLFCKKILPFGIQIYYHFWQKYLYIELKKLGILNKYDIIHQLTLATFRSPGFLWKSNKNFILGPVGGHDLIPFIIKKKLSKLNRFKENLREFINHLYLKYDKNLINCLNNSKLLIAKTNQTKFFLKKNINVKKKIYLGSEIGVSKIIKKNKILNSKIVNFLFIGRYIYIKGGDLIIDAFKKALKKKKNIRLTFYGEGNEKKKWLKKIQESNLNKYIKINNKIKNSKINRIYKSHDILIFGGLRDSGGTVILEALSNGLPIICFDTGGPGKFVNNKCGLKVNVNNNSNKEDIINNLSKNIIKISEDKNLFKKLSIGAIERAKIFTWNKIVNDVYKHF